MTRKVSILALAAAVAASLAVVPTAAADTFPVETNNWRGTPAVFEVNRLPATSRTVPLADLGSALGPVLEAEAASPWLTSLNGTWKFAWSPNPYATPEGFEAPSFDTSAWDEIEVPHNWQLDGFGAEDNGDIVYLNQRHPWQGYGRIAPPTVPVEHNSVGSYVRTFEVPAEWDGRRTILAFQGVKSALTVWVNGEEIGYSEDSYGPAEFDVTDALVDGTNTIAVEVLRWSDGSWLENQDQLDLSGIFRDVELYSVPQVHLEDHTVKVHLDDDYVDGELEIAAVVAQQDATAEADALRVRLFEDETAVLDTSLPLTFDADGVAEIALTEDVDSPALWTAEHPNLYTLVYEVLDGTDVVETISSRVGFREIEIIDGIQKLNGLTFDIKGVNRGEQHGDYGQAMPVEVIESDLVLMKQNNIDAVRTSHYPAHPALYHLADELGVYVMDEANLETHDMRPFPGNNAAWYDTVFDRFTTMYGRDKNHTSVLWWSMGNEVGSGTVFQDGAAWFKEVDPERLMHFQQDRALADIDGTFYPELDAVQRLADRGNGGKPWMMSEYSHAMGNSNGNLLEYWEIMDTAEWLQGGFIWEWSDQAVRVPKDGGFKALPIPEGTPESETYFSYAGDWGTYANDGFFSLDGIVNPDHTPHPAMDEIAAVYAPVAVAEQDLANGRVELRNEFMSTDLADVNLTWELRRDDVVVDDGTLEVQLAAGETAWVDLPVTEPADAPAGAEYWLDITVAAPRRCPGRPPATSTRSCSSTCRGASSAPPCSTPTPRPPRSWRPTPTSPSPATTSSSSSTRSPASSPRSSPTARSCCWRARRPTSGVPPPRTTCATPSPRAPRRGARRAATSRSRRSRSPRPRPAP
ncbi:beta-galactosidase [Serinibacter arcticus]|uniref:beta-galactosidase n=1 Tax=Serinibacter arcticus TaxID=1655435 RepID=A0A2U1ZXG0_9MICO|nr:beta-galactosidase [Serinibacter arcticus]